MREIKNFQQVKFINSKNTSHERVTTEISINLGIITAP